MARTFQIDLSPGRGYTRKVLFAAEIVDAATLEPIRQHIKVTASGLKHKPIVNGSGSYVWLDEGGSRPQQIIVETEGSPYESATVTAPALPKRSVRIELSPRFEYPFESGITAVRGTLIERRSGPRVGAAGADIWLRWIDANATVTAWVDTVTRSHANLQGDFAAILRLAPDQSPRTDSNGALRVRLAARVRGMTRSSPEFSIRQG
ncbi:hypothetical protein, partial [Microbacterium sp. P5_E9]